jgi:hypothetical protein
MNYNLIPLEVVKSITGATSDDVAATQGRAIVGMVQAYLGLVLVKQDFIGEKITVPYDFQRVIKPKFAPINAVCNIKVVTHAGTYKADTKAVSYGEYTIEILPRLWECLPRYVIPAAVGAIELDYCAGLYNDWSEVPAVIQEAMQELLKYKYNAGYIAGFNSEHLGDYSYSKGGFAANSGIPLEIAGMLDGLDL